MDPKVTVLMPVYNGEKHLREAIESILSQTFKDFEFLIINDGSTDSSEDIIKSYDDARIKLVNNDTNLKLVATLNKGIDMARGEYIARMDCDDISLTTRLMQQVKFLDSHSDIGLCGTWMRTIRSIGGLSFAANTWSYPIENDRIKSQLLFSSPFAHPTVMFRKRLMNRYELRYNQEYNGVEDWDLWKRCSENFNVANLPIVLLKYRITPGSITQSNLLQRLDLLKKIDTRNFSEYGVYLSEEDFRLLRSMYFPSDIAVLDKVHSWLISLSKAVSSRQDNNHQEYQNVIISQWLEACSNSGLGFTAWNKFFSLPLGQSQKLPLQTKVLFFLKCMLKWNGKKVGK